MHGLETLSQRYQPTLLHVHCTILLIVANEIKLMNMLYWTSSERDVLGEGGRRVGGWEREDGEGTRRAEE